MGADNGNLQAAGKRDIIGFTFLFQSKFLCFAGYFYLTMHIPTSLDVHSTSKLKGVTLYNSFLPQVVTLLLKNALVH